MDTIVINSENSEIATSRVLILNFTDKIGLRRGEKSIALSNRSIYYAWKNIKKPYNKNLKYQHQPGMISLVYQTDNILYQIFKAISSIFLKKNIMKELIIL